MMKVPMLDLKPQLATLREDIIEAVTKVVDSTHYILRPEIVIFIPMCNGVGEARIGLSRPYSLRLNLLVPPLNLTKIPL